MSDNKKNTNPLLNVSVTGATLEEYTQNAVLFPAMEQPTPVSEPLSTGFEQAGVPIYEQPILTYPPQSTDSIQFDSYLQQTSSTEGEKSFSTSVLNSFTNLLHIGGGKQATTDEQPRENYWSSDGAVAPPPLNEYLIQPNQFMPETYVPPSIPPIQASTTNTFRSKSKLSRPKYAPIPGLSSHTTPAVLQPLIPQAFTPPQSSPLVPTYAPDSPASFQQPPICVPAKPLETYNPHLDRAQTPTSSAILAPVDSDEALLFPSTQPLSTFTTTTPVLSPVSYFTPAHPNFAPPTMADTIQDSYNNNAANSPIHAERTPELIYRPVYNHWFHKKGIEGKVIWTPFTMLDSLALETAFTSNELSPEKVVATDGGRYDVNILRRERISVYWNSEPAEVRRCSWFHKGNADGRYVPYEENIAQKLEEEFRIAFELNAWNRKVDLANGETVIFHGPDVLVLFPPAQSPDTWGNTPNQPRPRVVKRGVDEFDIDEGEPGKVDHLLFLVHGIGSVCDLKFRSVEEVVDEFRSISLQLVQSHYRSSCEKGIANRVEVLPISWHEKLHSADTGVDSKLQGITLESIPRLRAFTNDTILDVLFYTSPVYCQTIIQSVGNEMNRIFDLFKIRNPSFEGGVSLGGHSLGSLIVFDLLCHQHPEPETVETAAPTETENEDNDVVAPLTLKPHPDKRRMSRRISYMMGAMGTGQPQLNYPHLNFNPKHFFALGSPIGMFVTVRGLDTLGEQFSLPTCPSFFNIFHPYDPVAYRIESLVNPELAGLKPVLIPHHKGRKRMHLELKETMARVGADLKQRLYDSMQSTWNSFYQFSLFKTNPSNAPNLQDEVSKVVEEKLMEQNEDEQFAVDEAAAAAVVAEPTDLNLGSLNQGKRIDYVLQEAPLEFFNEYIFALTSHVCYWESEDTMLLILKEIYNSMNVATDSQIPQQTMTIERTVPYTETLATSSGLVGMDPTAPLIPKQIAPPPTAGFVRKS